MVESLEADWQNRYEDAELQQVGEDWIERWQSTVLIVPSAIAPYERNIILNPVHPEFEQITIHPAEPLTFDGRLNSNISD